MEPTDESLATAADIIREYQANKNTFCDFDYVSLQRAIAQALDFILAQKDTPKLHRAGAKE